MPCPKPQQATAAAPAAAPTSACAWCETELPTLAAKLKSGASGDEVKTLHQHLTKFGMTIELSDFKSGKFQESTDTKKGSWGTPTTRAVHMFASHPAVGTETARVIKSNGKAIDAALVTKIQEWCKGGVVSPANYWEMKGLHLKAGDLDAAGAGATPEKQTVLHDFIVQIEKDLAATGFAKHKDSICGLDHANPLTGTFTTVRPDGKGRHEDIGLHDLTHLVKKLQRQATWWWRMKIDGTHLPDVSSTHPSTYGGAVNGEIDEATAKVLHHWAANGLHMVINKFPLEEFEWPPGSGKMVINGDSKGHATMRQDAKESWDLVAADVFALNGTLAGPYASSPRSWKGGKVTVAGASPFSWHYSALAIDISQALAGMGSINDAKPYGHEKEVATTRPTDRWFRTWCWVKPQPPAPATVAEDDAQPYLKYRNRNIKTEHAKGTPNETKVAGAPTAASTLYFATKRKNSAGTDVIDVTAKEGWYVDISAIFESHGWFRIPRHGDWLTNEKGWEFWHYQYKPDNPPGAADAPTFGEYLQIYGVHEAQLRVRGWSAHEDVDHPIG